MKCIQNFAGNSKISAGSHHSLVLSTNNETYSFGYNRYGQLGVKDDKTKSIPTKISITENSIELPIKKVSAGSFHSLFLTTDHKVFACGENSVNFQKNLQFNFSSFHRMVN